MPGTLRVLAPSFAALLVVSSLTASAQGEEAPAAPPPAAEPAAPPPAPPPPAAAEPGAPAVEAPRRRRSLDGGTVAAAPAPVFSDVEGREAAKGTATRFMQRLLQGDARSAFGEVGFPFQLEDRRVSSPEELFKELLQQLRDKRTDLLTLYDVEVFSPAEMEAKHGKPPARLASFPYRSSSKNYLAVANVSGRGVVLLLQPGGRFGYYVAGFTD